jgi:hypothetical protein
VLAGFLPAWDVERRKTDVDRIARFALEEIRARGIPAPSLEHLHRVVTREEAPHLARHLTYASRHAEARSAIHALVREGLPALPWEAIAIQSTVHFRVLVPGDAISPVPPHTDFGIGHALDERNLWIALTPARGKAALHLASFRESIAIDEARREAGRLLVDADVALRAEEADAGDVLLFTPLHVHGARVVDGDTTRVSIDVRILPLEVARTRNPYGYVEVA